MVLREDRAITTRKTKKLIFLVVMSVLVSLSKEHLVTSMKPLFVRHVGYKLYQNKCLKCLGV